jgi:hypothetical protein
MYLPCMRLQLTRPCAYFADITGFKIPLHRTVVVALVASLPTSLHACLKAVDGYHKVAADFASMVEDTPTDLGSELTATLAVVSLCTRVFTLLDKFHPANIGIITRANKSETQAGSSSQLVGAKLRPDELFIWEMCTLMLCEDKVSVHNCLREGFGVLMRSTHSAALRFMEEIL